MRPAQNSGPSVFIDFLTRASHARAALTWLGPIEWPLPAAELSASERDARAPLLREIAGELPFEYAP